ncbi:hypothetical protein GQ42DRAFT_163439 [Ramicandelaber brevisporus]|nr:hypothetical protein GQ42DRAFT_163439 [Ramicandelaber brevisporus]
MRSVAAIVAFVAVAAAQTATSSYKPEEPSTSSYKPTKTSPSASSSDYDGSVSASASSSDSYSGSASASSSSYSGSSSSSSGSSSSSSKPSGPYNPTSYYESCINKYKTSPPYPTPTSTPAYYIKGPVADEYKSFTNGYQTAYNTLKYITDSASAEKAKSEIDASLSAAYTSLTSKADKYAAEQATDGNNGARLAVPAALVGAAVAAALF